MAPLRFLPLLIALMASAWSADAVVVIDAGQDRGAVNRRVFGHNVEAADPRGIYVPLGTVDWESELIRTGGGLWDPAARAVVPAIGQRLRAAGISALRYPGGSLANGWDWHLAVGPLAGRGDWTFGLDEYLTACRSLGAEPVIILSDYTGTPQDLADLVEYLNAPADGHHTWADRRAAWGHPEPWGVRWFELGNETNLGNAQMVPRRRMTGSEYVAWARDVAVRVKAVDPTVQLGAVTVPGTLEQAEDPWNRTVLTSAASFADFVILHLYAPVVADGTAPALVAPACLAAGEQLVARIAEHRRFAQELSGRDLPVWVTEFNVMAVQETPQPYRFSWAAGLMGADLQRRLLEPGLVTGACYWQAVNGYWGMIETRLGADIVERAPFAAQQLLAGHVGARLVGASVTTPRIEAAGFPGLWPCHGDTAQPAAELGVVTGPDLTVASLTAPWGSPDLTGGVLSVRLTNATAEAHSDAITTRTRPSSATAGCAYRIAFRGRFQADAGSGRAQLGLNVLDARGWSATGSALAITGVEDAADWQEFTATFFALPDAPGIIVGLRLSGPIGAVSGLLQIKDVVISATTLPTAAAVPRVVATATRTGDQVHLVLIHRGLDTAQRVVIRDAVARYGAARCWVLTSDTPASTAAPVMVRNGEALAPAADGTWSLDVPPAALVAVEFTIAAAAGGGSGTPAPAATPSNDTGGGCGAGSALGLGGVLIIAFCLHRRRAR